MYGAVRRYGYADDIAMRSSLTAHIAVRLGGHSYSRKSRTTRALMLP